MKIEVANLHHVYPTGEEALKGITFTIEGTQPVAIIGQNGSGKTTLAKHLNGLLRPTSGDVLLNGASITTQSAAKWSRHVGYMFQNPDEQLFLDAVQKELEFGPRRLKMPKDKMNERVQYAAEVCGLSNLMHKHPFDLTPVQKKFCAIASIISMDPEVFILDEPTGGQDLHGVRMLSEVVQTLSKDGKLCLTISHDMKFVVENFPRVVVLCMGEVLLDGTPEEVFSQVETLAKSYVTPPPITRIGQAVGLTQTVFSVSELTSEIESRRYPKIRKNMAHVTSRSQSEKAGTN
jgi:energy-coupling factor transport system ATP-binding protein